MDTIEKSIERILLNRSGKQRGIQSMSNKLMEIDEYLGNDLLKFNSTEYRDIFINLRDGLNFLRRRFTRKTINIVVIGHARQGKSRLLQSITGLDKTCIPDGDSLDCTAVKSVIINTAEREDAKVYFYSREEFFEEVILPYYSELQLAPPSSLIEFEHDSQIDKLSLSGVAAELKKHLLSYQQNFAKYKSLLGSGEKQIAHSLIRQYVAQDDEEGNREVYFNYFAIKYVEIFSKFPQEEIGRITVIDLPGIGDTKLGIEQNIMKEIKNNVDIVYFIKMPSDKGDHLEQSLIDLYDEIRNVITPIPLEKCSYLILNHDQRNMKQCKKILEEMPTSGLKVIDAKIVDVSDKKDVKILLQQSLLDLIKNIDSIDQNYIHSVVDQTNRLTNLIKDELEEIVMSAFDDVAVNKTFNPLVDKWVQNFRKLLTDKVGELDEIQRIKGRERFNSIFEDNIVQVKEQALEKKSLYKDEILEKLKSSSYLNDISVIQDIINTLRTRLAKEFFGIDEYLEVIMEQMKKDIVDIFFNETINLNKILPDNIDPKNTISELEKKLSKENGEEDNGVLVSLQNFRQFKLLYRGIMHNKVREKINKYLFPGKQSMENEWLNYSELVQWDAEDIVEKLIEENYDNAVNESIEALYEFRGTPDATVASITEELVDGVIGENTAKYTWYPLLDRYKGKIWEHEFSEFYKERENYKKVEELKKSIQKVLQEMDQSAKELK